MASSDSGRDPAADEPTESLALGQVIDHALLDRNGRRAGRVDDLQIDVVEASDPAQPPTLVLRAIVSGPLPRPTSAGFAALARFCYRLLGVRNPAPATVEWRHVRAIDAFVHLDVDRADANLLAVHEAALRIVEKLPGSDKEHQ